MPAEIFGPAYQFLERGEVLSFEEIIELTKTAVSLGVSKVRLTGGEPLLRRGITDLVALLAAVEGIEDLAMTSNGVLLAHHAPALAAAGLTRVTVSLDALSPAIFSQMNGVGAKVERVLAGISAAQKARLPVKVNCVVQRGVNEDEILPLLRWGLASGVTVRFIEYMDVGESNGWELSDVYSQAEILGEIEEEFTIQSMAPAYLGEVANRWTIRDRSGRSGEFGIISSVSQPFCGACSRMRISADGKMHTCLFSEKGDRSEIDFAQPAYG